MKQWILGIALLASPLQAQPVTRAEIDSIKTMLGLAGAYGPQIPCDQIEANRPTTNLPYGEYGISYRIKQLGCAFNGVVARLASLQPSSPTAPAPVVIPAPPSCANCFPPLSTVSKNEVIAALRRSTGGVQWVIDNVE